MGNRLFSEINSSCGLSPGHIAQLEGTGQIFQSIIPPFPNNVKPNYKDALKLRKLHENCRPGSRQLLPHQVLELVEKRLLVLEVPINRRESYIRNFVELTKTFHQEFSYFCS